MCEKENFTLEGVLSGVAWFSVFCGVLEDRMAGEAQPPANLDSSFPKNPLK